MTAESFFGLLAVAFGLFGLLADGHRRARSLTAHAHTCVDCEAPAGNHYYSTCPRVHFVVEAAVGAFRGELDRWDGSLDEIRSVRP